MKTSKPQKGNRRNSFICIILCIIPIIFLVSFIIVTCFHSSSPRLESAPGKISSEIPEIVAEEGTMKKISSIILKDEGKIENGVQYVIIENRAQYVIHGSDIDKFDSFCFASDIFRADTEIMSESCEICNKEMEVNKTLVENENFVYIPKTFSLLETCVESGMNIESDIKIGNCLAFGSSLLSQLISYELHTFLQEILLPQSIGFCDTH